MQLQEMRQKNTKDLKTELLKQTKELEKIMNDILQNKEKNVKKARFLRKDIARLNTVINEKKILEGEK